MERQKHKWIGWGYDNTICEHCRVDVYNPFTVRGEYCDEYPAELEAWEEGVRTKPVRIKLALDKCREALTEEEYNLLNLRYFGEYRPRDYIKV